MDHALKFRQAYLCEEMNGLYWTPDYEVIRWREGGVFISFTRQGDAIACHFSSDRQSLSKLRDAMHDFFLFARQTMPWCIMTIGCIKRDSVVRLMKSCGFWHVVDRKNVKIYARYL